MMIYMFALVHGYATSYCACTVRTYLVTDVVLQTYSQLEIYSQLDIYSRLEIYSQLEIYSHS